MNKIILSLIAEREKELVPVIFTKKQFEVIKKRIKREKLTNAEKKALYTSITKKVKAIESIYRQTNEAEYYVNGGSKILSERFSEAKKIIEQYSKKYEKIFISGTFLFSQKYTDIDIFIVREKGYKEIFDGKKHIIFLTEKRLSQPIFQSASLMSVSNFKIPTEINTKEPSLFEIMSLYHEAVIECLNQDKKPESTRRLIFYNELLCNKKILNSQELKEKTENAKIIDLNQAIKNLCISIFSKKYLYVKIQSYIKTLINSIKNIKPNKHLIIFRNTYEELIYGRQRSTATVD